jgi:hypothetical protein
VSENHWKEVEIDYESVLSHWECEIGDEEVAIFKPFEAEFSSDWVEYAQQFGSEYAVYHPNQMAPIQPCETEREAYEFAENYMRENP